MTEDKPVGCTNPVCYCTGDCKKTVQQLWDEIEFKKRWDIYDSIIKRVSAGHRKQHME